MTVADGNGNVVSLMQSLFLRIRIRHRRLRRPASPCTTAGAVQSRSPAIQIASRRTNGPCTRSSRPFVMKDNKPWLSFGVMGGDHQAQGHTQVLVNLIDFGMNIQEAGEAARVHHGANGLLVESAVAQPARASLIRRGHRVSESVGAFGGFQGILIDPQTGVLMGGSDPRKDGLAIGTRNSAETPQDFKAPTPFSGSSSSIRTCARR
jgi:gamma-glutamyltranspeptidase/glutathione hydrolase